MRLFSFRKSFLCFIYIVGLLCLFFFLWRTTLDFTHQESLPPRHGDLLGCGHLKEIALSKVIGNGWIKTVYSVYLGNLNIAVKTVNKKGVAMKRCNMTASKCYTFLGRSLEREAKILRALRHPNIIKLLGSCFFASAAHNGSESSLVIPSMELYVIFTEIGQPLMSFTLVQMTFEERLKIALDLSSLLYFLASIPAGPSYIADFRIQQFVLVKNTLKLADVDDLQFGERKCKGDTDCFVSQQFQIKVPCLNNSCQGLTDRLNVARSYGVLLRTLLSIGTPKAVSDLVERILVSCKEGSMTSEQLLLKLLSVKDFLSPAMSKS